MGLLLTTTLQTWQPPTLLKKFPEEFSSNIQAIVPKPICFLTSVFDNVHLLQNIQNNLLNSLKFAFFSFSFYNKDRLAASSENGYIS